MVIGQLAERDIRDARAWFNRQEDGLGDQFFEPVKETVRRIAANPDIYRPVFGDARRAPVKSFRYSVWFRIAPDASIVIQNRPSLRDGRPGSPSYMR